MERFSLLSTILILLTGWPGIITSLAISVAGIRRKNPAWLIAGAILAVPFSWYLSQTPLFKHVGLLLPLFQLGAAVAVHKRVTWLAWLLLMPFAGIAGWLGMVVLMQ
ncbi:MAG: hypothetical protein M5U10_08790 [Candidatus Methanoperedens sp.]|uniref:hypothetical protein n=1 Tax=Candidatus Methanoperedens nitratireducens TaxID=1392998 RepID=UPI00064E74C1|nr:hypothetical protein [Candidatus Methanoperedens nitroreducens]MDJ1421997.1 hypothetical protein [Candidatus Methanoperedens sp.]